MVQIVRSMWIWGATLVLILVWSLVMGVVRLFDRDPARKRTARSFRQLGRMMAKVQPWRVHITGSEHISPDGTYVVVSNHQSLADIPLISHLRMDTKWLAKAELFRIPVIGWMLRMAGDISVDRGDRRKGAQALLAAGRYIRAKCSVVFFPEGTRSLDGALRPFSEGPFQLAIREQVPVLPLVVHGSGSALPRGTWLFGPTQDIHLRVLEPVPVTGRTKNDNSELCSAVRQLMVDELAAIQDKSDRAAGR